MSGSGFGTIFKITTFGESHGPGIGTVIDGCPAGLPLCAGDIQKELDKRRPGISPFTSPRREADIVSVLSGVFNGFTTGAPIALLISNTNQRSDDYEALRDVYRPGCADYTYDKKYKTRDHRGGGRASGRETSARVAAGAVAQKILGELDITVSAYPAEIGGLSAGDAEVRPMLERAVQSGDSLGGTVECVIKGVKPGVGEPVFRKLDAELSKAVMSIGGVKGIEFGTGFKAAVMSGSSHNDEFYYDSATSTVKKMTNHAGGVLGGLSDGSDIVFRAAVKPTPSISKPQRTVNSKGENIEISLRGRFDTAFVLRVAPVVSAMAAITLVDLIFVGLSANMDSVKSLFLD